MAVIHVCPTHPAATGVEPAPPRGPWPSSSCRRGASAAPSMGTGSRGSAGRANTCWLSWSKQEGSGLRPHCDAQLFLQLPTFRNRQPTSAQLSRSAGPQQLGRFQQPEGGSCLLPGGVLPCRPGADGAVPPAGAADASAGRHQGNGRLRRQPGSMLTRGISCRCKLGATSRESPG